MGVSKGTSISYRMTELFTVLINFFYDEEESLGYRFLLAVGENWYLFYFGAERLLKARRIESYAQLCSLMGQGSSRFINTLIDNYALVDKPLPHLFRLNRSGVIQFFYLVRQRKVDIWVLDERGVLFTQEGADLYDDTTLINQFNHFFEAVINRITFLSQEG